MDYYQVEALASFDTKMMPNNSQTQDSKQNNDSEASDIVNFLTFEKGDRLMVKVKYENGWLYGSLFQSKADEALIDGFFPSNYVKEVIEEPKELVKNEEKEENKEIKEIIDKKDKKNEKKEEKTQNIESNKRKPEGNWMEFVKDIISDDKNEQAAPLVSKIHQEIDENDILNEALVQENYNSIIGYKKVKITNDPSQALKKKHQFGQINNPTPVLNNEFAMVFISILIHLFICFYYI